MGWELDRIHAEKCRRSYYLFVQHVFSSILEPGKVMSPNWHLEELCNQVQARVEDLLAGRPCRDLVVNVPPGSLKSTIISKCVAAWAWANDPSFCHMGLAYEKGLARRDSSATRQIVESPWYQAHFGIGKKQATLRAARKKGIPESKVAIQWVELKRDTNRQDEFETTAGGLRYATGIDGAATGRHFHLITVDDPHDPRRASSETERTSACVQYDTALQTRVKNKSNRSFCFIVIMQRLHQKDLSGHVLAKQPERYDRLCIPAELSQEVQPPELADKYVGGLFFPSEFPPEFLASMKSALGPTAYAAQYQQRPSAPAGNMIKSEHFGYYKCDGDGWPQDVPRDVAVNYYCDTAFGQASQERLKKNRIRDYSVIFAWLVHQGQLYILAMSRNRLESPEWRRHLVEFVRSNWYTEASRVYIEPKANGKQQIQELRQGVEHDGETHYLNIIEAPLPPNSGKEERIENQKPKLEAGKVLLPEGQALLVVTMDTGETYSIHVQPWVLVAMEEWLSFPNADHDDTVDCLEGSMRWGLRVSVYDKI